MDPRNKTVLITGAAQGFGRAFALDLAKAGAQLVLADLQEAALEETRLLCAAEGVQCAAYRVDVARERQVTALFERVDAEFGALDVLVNNAGITRDAPLIGFDVDGGVKRHSLRDWQMTIDVNLTGAFLCAREAAARMAAAGGGLIVNLSSVTRIGNPGQSGYAAAKAGVASLTATWAHELASSGIRVAAIAPGYIDTPMTAGVSETHRERLLAAIPMGRLGEAAEIVGALRFIIENEYVNGRIIEVDGGLRL